MNLSHIMEKYKYGIVNKIQYLKQQKKNPAKYAGSIFYSSQALHMASFCGTGAVISIFSFVTG